MTHVIAGNASVSGVTHVIPGGADVSGVTSLGDDVFVVRRYRSQQVEVYDAVTFTLQRRLRVPGLGTKCMVLEWENSRYVKNWKKSCCSTVPVA